ncbi:histidine triad nucleotide-binding protein [Spirochaeta thermophila]|uniref:HIT-like protein tag-202 n=1 Tax=Winmispira thermophila (strain ATCC 49972 / DSM 6192 / RI 19.B1) TaxID=665571 RepID=E0RPM5_WINT6|nr:histidine triad nucleotide-binding protein [Spirochaeta thermophila]ADN01339.1 HIT-like protein tag-202 [Spirochaeta thermophila DSM 6192]
MGDTIFDKIVRKEIPSDVVFEDEVALAFRDINPQAPVHVLVLPKRRAATLTEFTEQDPSYLGEFLKRVSMVAKQLGLEENGFRVVINQGRHGQQSVAYLHVHILGGRQMEWPPG